jgi:hypothetical protein
MENIDPKTKLGNLFLHKVLKYELLLLFLIILAVCLTLMKTPYSGLFLTMVLLSIACIYFFSAFGIPEVDEFTAIDSFLHKLVSLGSSVAIIGILFIIQKWPNAETMIYVGILTLGMCFIVLVYQRIKNPEIEKFNKLVFLRILVLILIAGGFLYLQKK